MALPSKPQQGNLGKNEQGIWLTYDQGKWKALQDHWPRGYAAAWIQTVDNMGIHTVTGTIPRNYTYIGFAEGLDPGDVPEDLEFSGADIARISNARGDVQANIAQQAGVDTQGLEDLLASVGLPLESIYITQTDPLEGTVSIKEPRTIDVNKLDRAMDILEPGGRWLRAVRIKSRY